MNTDNKKQPEVKGKAEMKRQLLTDDELDMVSGGGSMDYKVYYCNDCEESFAIPFCMTRVGIKCVKCGRTNCSAVDGPRGRS